MGNFAECDVNVSYVWISNIMLMSQMSVLYVWQEQGCCVYVDWWNDSMQNLHMLAHCYGTRKKKKN